MKFNNLVLRVACGLILLPGLLQQQCLVAANQEEDPQGDVAEPHFIPFSPKGAVVVCGGGRLPEDVRKLFVVLAGGAQARILVIPTASMYADTKTDAYWTENWLPLKPESVTVLHTRDRKVADSEEFAKKIEDASGVWFSGGDQSRLSEVFLGTRAQMAFERVALRGGVIGGTSAGAAIASQVMIADGRETPVISQGLNLVPWAIMDQHFSQRDRITRLREAVRQNPLRVGLGIDESTAVVFRSRSTRVVGEGNATVILAATKTLPAFELKLAPGDQADWTTFVRQTHERSRPLFPVALESPPVFSRGSLVMVGGGQVIPEIVKRFVDLAGGADAKIVILPTATTRPPSKSGEESIFRKAGANFVVTLPQIELGDIHSEDYLQQLREATGIWFGGGRQWHFVDHYEGTKALEEMRNCLARGGVIGGSSAGASILGDLLIRGAPVGNEIMVQDGYRRGFAFLPGVGIDQHFSQRNRMEDLRSTIAKFPSIVGIGIDESTALVVTPEAAEVLGKGSVFVFSAAGFDSNDVIEVESATDVESQVFETGNKFPLQVLVPPASSPIK